MALEFRDVMFVKVYTGEDVILGDKPLYKAIIEEAMRLGLAGGTTFEGTMGFAAASKKRGVGRAVNYLVSGRMDRPVTVEIVDKAENIEKILPFLEKNAHSALVTVRKTTILVTDYMRCKEAEQMKQQENCGPQMQIQQQQ